MSNKYYKSNATAKNSRKSSLSDLKTVIQQVYFIQYESKVKMLENTRNSKSPPYVKRRINTKSSSFIEDDSRNCIKSSRETNTTSNEYNIKTPEYCYTENECCRTLKNENSNLQQKIFTIRLEFEQQINQLKYQFETEKKSEIDSLNKFYAEKLIVWKEICRIKA